MPAQRDPVCLKHHAFIRGKLRKRKSVVSELKAGVIKERKRQNGWQELPVLDQELHTKAAGEGSPQTTGHGDRAGDLEAPSEGQISGSKRREEEGSALHGQKQTCPPKGSWRAHGSSASPPPATHRPPSSVPYT